MNRPDSRRVPQEQINGVVKALYADADRLDWEHLAPSGRTAQYDQWVGDPAIGVVLTRHMSSENARSWIKDGPMKEYGRARQGAGRYAKFGSAQGATPEQIARHALGPTASVVEGSVGVKPFHLAALAEAGATPTYVAWGGAKNLRHLVWACLSYLADNPAHVATVVITETMADPTTAGEKNRHSRIAERCSLDLKYFRTTSPRPRSAGGARLSATRRSPHASWPQLRIAALARRWHCVVNSIAVASGTG